MQSLQADQRNTDLCIRQVYRLIKCIQSSPDIKANGIILRDEKITNQVSGQIQVFSPFQVTNKKSPKQKKRKERKYTFPCFLSMLYSIPQATNYSEFSYERKHTDQTLRISLLGQNFRNLAETTVTFVDILSSHANF